MLKVISLSYDNNDRINIKPKVSITVDDKKVELPTKPHPSDDPTAFLVSHITGEKVPISTLQKLYDIYGSYNKVAKETGISDKTIKKYVRSSSPITSTPTEHLKISQAEQQGYRETRVSNTQHVGVKASRLADAWVKSQSQKLSDVMTALLESLSDPVVISRASLRDRAIAFGIVTERLQKSKELAIRQDESEIKRIEASRRDEEMELRKREIAAMEKGVSIQIVRKFHGDEEPIEDVDVVEEGGNNSGN